MPFLSPNRQLKALKALTVKKYKDANQHKQLENTHKILQTYSKILHS